MGICWQKNFFRMKILNTQVLIIGGGVTGTGIARDLALRGVKCILPNTAISTREPSGGNHGLLFSGTATWPTMPPPPLNAAKKVNF